MWYLLGLRPADCAPARTPKKSYAPALSSNGRAYPEQLDTLFTFITILIIFTTAANMYGGNGWTFYLEVTESNIFLGFITTTGKSLMGALFVISGYLAAVSIRRELSRASKLPGQRNRARACWAFVKSKLTRLGLAAAFYTFFLHYLVKSAAEDEPLSWLTYKEHLGFWTEVPGVRGHTWVCALTLIFDILFAAHTWLKLPSLPVHTYTPQLIFVLSPIVTFLWLRVSPVDTRFDPLGLESSYLPQHILAYVTGIFLSKRPQLVFPDKPRDWSTSPLPIFFLYTALTVFLLQHPPAQHILDSSEPRLRENLDDVKFLFCLSNELCFVMLTHTALYLSHRWTKRTPPGTASSRVLPGLAYGAFLVHATVCNVLAREMRGFGLAPVPKALLVGSLSTVISFVLSACLARIPGMRHMISSACLCSPVNNSVTQPTSTSDEPTT